MRFLLPCGLLALPALAAAQVLPQPGTANPRLQTMAWKEGQEVMLTALPQTGLTVLLEPGEQVTRVALGDGRALEVRVSAERDSFLVLPKQDLAGQSLLVQTDRRSYRFSVRTDTSLMAAYLVRFTYGDPPVDQSETEELTPGGQVWHYRLKGDGAVRPSAISDDGSRTTIAFAPDQPLPAIFALGPTGGEEVVNGYMRGGQFVIDRVHAELVFRIDRARATARRAAAPEGGGG